MSPVRPLITARQIEVAVEKLGGAISADYKDRPLTILAILTGSIVLVADLMRKVTIPHQLGMLQASSYRGLSTSPGLLRINDDFLPQVAGRDVLLVDDILDTGRTLTAILDRVERLNPNSIKTAVLLWKKSRTVVDLKPDYFCFDIPDEFVVGYGLDFNDEYRQLPFIGVIDE